MSFLIHTAPTDRLGMTLFLAMILHAIVILGVSFDIEKLKKEAPPDRTLEILVVRQPNTPKKPEKADFLAQTDQQGGGTLEEKVRPTTRDTRPAPLPAPIPATENRPSPPPTPVKRQPNSVIASKAPAEKKVTIAPKSEPIPLRKKTATAAQLLASSEREIHRLTAELDRKTNAYAQRPRRKFISASTQEYKYASYLDAWRKKVERIGNLNYPDEAKRQKLYGNLILHVAIRADGTVKEINLRKSSGHKLLDDAAIRIVRLSAPFAPFPSEIREETDIIDIIRTWQFRSNNRLFSK